MDSPKELHPHNHCMMHCQSHLIKTIIQSQLIKQTHGKDLMKDQIHNPPSPPLHELVTSLHSPEPQSVIVMEVVCHIIAPMMKLMFRTMILISRVEFVGIHTLPDL